MQWKNCCAVYTSWPCAKWSRCHLGLFAWPNFFFKAIKSAEIFFKKCPRYSEWTRAFSSTPVMVIISLHFPILESRISVSRDQFTLAQLAQLVQHLTRKLEVMGLSLVLGTPVYFLHPTRAFSILPEQSLWCVSTLSAQGRMYLLIRNLVPQGRQCISRLFHDFCMTFPRQ